MRLNEPRFATPVDYNYTAFRNHISTCKATGFPMEYDWFDYLTRIVGIGLAWMCCLQIIIFKLLACLRMGFEDRFDRYSIPSSETKTKTPETAVEMLPGSVEMMPSKSAELVPDKLAHEPIVKRWNYKAKSTEPTQTGSGSSVHMTSTPSDQPNGGCTAPTQASTQRKKRLSKEQTVSPRPKKKQGSRECLTQNSSKKKQGSRETICSNELIKLVNKKQAPSGSHEQITQGSPRNKPGSRELITPIKKASRGSREQITPQAAQKKKGSSPSVVKTVVNTTQSRMDGAPSVKLPRAKSGFHEQELQIMEDLCNNTKTMEEISARAPEDEPKKE